MSNGEEGSQVKLRSGVEPCKPWDAGSCHAQCRWKSLGKRIKFVFLKDDCGWNLEPEWKWGGRVDSVTQVSDGCGSAWDGGSTDGER